MHVSLEGGADRSMMRSAVRLHQSAVRQEVLSTMLVHPVMRQMVQAAATNRMIAPATIILHRLR